MKSIFIGIACLLLFTQNKAQNYLTDSLLKVFENQTGTAKAATAKGKGRKAATRKGGSDDNSMQQ